jgi:putative acetyltransferase
MLPADATCRTVTGYPSSGDTVAGMEIREEGAADRPAVLSVHLAAFGESGARVAQLVEGLTRELDGENGLSLVATEHGAVVGHALFTRSLLDAPRELVAVQVLSPLGVRPEAQGRGIGSSLVRRGLEMLDGRRVPLVFLEGDPRLYSRFGFVAGAGMGFRKPSLRIPDAGFQVVPLAAYQPWMTGTLVYAAPFWEHDLVGRREAPHS